MKTPPKKSAKKAAVSTSAGRKRVTFQVTAEASSEVAVAGSFNEWQPQPLAAASGKGTVKFSKILFLAPGTYQYKFIIDGEWLPDPACQETVPNEFGNQNSQVQVG